MTNLDLNPIWLFSGPRLWRKADIVHKSFTSITIQDTGERYWREVQISYQNSFFYGRSVTAFLVPQSKVTKEVQISSAIETVL